jgi:protein-L-isoaspartate(D-aspartate) O-methyltransferase
MNIMHSNQELVEYLIAHHRLTSPPIIAAFRAIDRQDFVPDNQKEWAYQDQALYIGHDATISQPSTVAFMLEKLKPAVGDKVLDIGAGSGWTTALLAHIVGSSGNVYGVEIIPPLVTFGNNNLLPYDLPHAHIEQATETLGLPTQAPFDKILVSASATDIPDALLLQLRVGGILVIPIQEAIRQIRKLSDTQIDTHEYPGFVFVPLQA